MFIGTSVVPPVYAQNTTDLPVPGSMVPVSTAYVPVLLKGMTVHPEDPYRFDFIVDNGHTALAGDQLKQETKRLVNYFLGSMTVSQKDLWVNLSPVEKDRIIPDALGKTELGQDLLAQDYVLKQLTATLMYPEGDLGKEFWQKVYAQAREEYGTVDIPTDTFNKVWITPASATVYEKGPTVYVVDAKLKVMLDADRLAADQVGSSLSLDIAQQLMRSIIIPAIEKEVNAGKNFAPLRQIYHALILAKWYKQKIKDSILFKVYIDQSKVKGIDLASPTAKRDIYDRYLQAYQKGVYNYIKEEYDPVTQESVPRKYFSGGFTDALIEFDHTDSPQAVRDSVTGQDTKFSFQLEPQTVLAVLPDGSVTFNGYRFEKMPLDHERWQKQITLLQRMDFKAGGVVVEIGPGAIVGLGIAASTYEKARAILVDPDTAGLRDGLNLTLGLVTDSDGQELQRSEKIQTIYADVQTALQNGDLKEGQADVVTLGGVLDDPRIPEDVKIGIVGSALKLLRKGEGCLLVQDNDGFILEHWISDIGSIAQQEFGIKLVQDREEHRILRVQKDDAMIFEEIPQIALSRFNSINPVPVRGHDVQYAKARDGKDEALIYFLTPGAEVQQKEELLKKISAIYEQDIYKENSVFLPELGRGFVQESDLTAALQQTTRITQGQEYFILKKVSSRQIEAHIAMLKHKTFDSSLALDLSIISFMKIMAEFMQLFNSLPSAWRYAEVDVVHNMAGRYAQELLLKDSKIREGLSYLKAAVRHKFYPWASVEEFSSLMDGLSITQILTYFIDVHKNIDVWYEMEQIVKKWGIAGKVEGIPELEKYFNYEQYPDPRYRFAALQAIGLINSHKGVPLLIKGLRGVKGTRGGWTEETRQTKQIEERFTRKLAAQLLGQLQDVRANTPLIEALDDPDERIFDEALASLVKVGGEDTVTRLNALRSQEPRTRMSELYDDHSLVALYTQVPRNMKTAIRFSRGINMDNLKFVKEVESENARIGKITGAINALISKNAAYRDSVTIDLDKIVDKRITVFMAWLKEQGLDKFFVLVGGGVRDSFTGDIANDFDINVIVPLTEEEKQRGLTFSNQATPETYQYCMDKLKLLADRLGADVDQFMPPVKGKKPVVWKGVVDGVEVEVEIQYTGPIKLFNKEEGRPVYLMRSIVSESGEIYLSQAGASILTLGMDAHGKIYGRANALKYFTDGLIVLAGSAKYLSLGAVLRFLRVKHQYQKKILKQNYQQLSNYVGRYLSGKVEMQGVMKLIVLEQTKKILKTARDPQAAFDELKAMGIIRLIEKTMGELISSIEDVENMGGPVDALQPPNVTPAEEAALSTGLLDNGDQNEGDLLEDKDNADLIDKGGIDMNDIVVTNTGVFSRMQFDPAAVTDAAITGFSPVIISVTPVDDILPLLGLK